MGNNIIGEATVPDLESFKSIVNKIDKLRKAGFSLDEIHHIFNEYSSQRENFKKSSLIPFKNGKQRLINLNSLRRTFEEEIPTKSNGLILLVDDSLLASTESSKVLKEFNFEVIHCRDAKSGYDKLNEKWHELSVIFLDVVMPGVDGLECLNWIHVNSTFRHIPIYMLSGLDDPLLKTACIEKGAVDLIMKPLNPAKLRKVIKEQNIELLELNPPLPAISSTTKSGNESSSQLEITSSQLGVGRMSAPSFKLCDSDFHPFSYPADCILENTLLVFIPTIFYGPLYDQSNRVSPSVATDPATTSTDSFPSTALGVINQLVEHFEAMSKAVNILVVSGDLPFALSAAKIRFNLPFRLLSDPSLAVSKELMGVMNIGDLLGRTDFDDTTAEEVLKEQTQKQTQNQILNPPTSTSKRRPTPSIYFKSDKATTPSNRTYHSSPDRCSFGPVLGFVLVNKRRDIIKKMSFPMVRLGPDKCISLPVNPIEWIRMTCFLVDDSQLFLKAQSKVVESCGMAVRCYSSAQIALEDLKKPDCLPCLLLVDIVMPDCDGLSMLRLLREETGKAPDLEQQHQHQHHNVPVVLMSDLPVNGQEELLASCRAMGAFDVLKKPFNKQRFQRLLQQLGLANPT